MTQREIGKAFFRLLGAYFVLGAVHRFLASAGWLLHGLLSASGLSSRGVFGAPSLLHASAPILFGILVILFSGPLAGLLFGKSADRTPPAGIHYREAAALGFAILGLWFAVAGLGSLVGVFVELMAYSDATGRGLFLGANWPRISPHAFQAIVGVALYFCAPGLAGARRSGEPAGQERGDPS